MALSHPTEKTVLHEGVAAAARTTSLLGARVLVAEDNAVNLAVATFHLEDLGCVSVGAEDGAIALARAMEQRFEFVLMDCQMPVMDGFAALRAIRDFEASQNLRPATIISVTAADDEDTQLQCAAAGFDGFLAKPFTAQKLQDVMLQPHVSLPRTGQLSDNPSERVLSSNAENGSAAIDRDTFSAFIADFGLDTAPSLLTPFVNLLRETAVRLAKARLSNDAPAMQSLAHKVAGAAGTTGALHLSRCARTVEAVCKRGHTPSAADLASLDTALSAALPAFEPLLAPQALAAFVAATAGTPPQAIQFAPYPNPT